MSFESLCRWLEVEVIVPVLCLGSGTAQRARDTASPAALIQPAHAFGARKLGDLTYN